MIHIFRKELKKWKSLGWVIFASFVISSFAVHFLRQPKLTEILIATIDGKKIYYDDYSQSFIRIKKQLDMYRHYSRMFNMPEEFFLQNFLQGKTPQAIALEGCINDSIVDRVKDSFNIQIEDTFLKNEMIRELPKDFFDEKGVLVSDRYNSFVKSQNMTPSEYESFQLNSLKRSFTNNLIQQSLYVPYYVAQNMWEANGNVKKKFGYIIIPYAKYYEKAEKKGSDDNKLTEFIGQKKERYRIKEKRKSEFWKISLKEYEKHTSISDSLIQSYYNKNKSTLFRINPKVNVKRIFFNKFSDKDKKADSIDKVKKIFEEVKKEPEKFNSFVEKYSEDETTKKSSGLTGFFEKGSYGKEFELAAFRLHNKGEIGELVSTSEGYEILQLEDRIKASEKPLEKVKNEILKTLIEKRTKAKLTGDLNILLRKAAIEKGVTEDFIKKNDLKREESDWLSIDEKDEFSALLSKSLFESKKKKDVFGYFAHKENYFLFRQIDIQKSYIPKLDEVKDTVRKDYYKDKASEEIKKVGRKIKAMIIEKNKNLEEIAKEFNFKYKQTDLISNVKDIKDIDKDLKRVKLFALTNEKQALYYKNNDDEDGYIFQFIKQEEMKDENTTQKVAELKKSKEEDYKRNQALVFVDSILKCFEKANKVVINNDPSILLKKGIR